MKLSKSFFLLGLMMTALCFTGCGNDDFQEVEKSEVITITADVPNQEATRVNFGKENFALSWKEGDAFQVYSHATAGQKFDFTGRDAHGKGRFQGNKPAAANEMYAYYPASKSLKTGYDNDVFDYTGQTQVGNDNVDALSNYLYMTGTVNPVDYTVSDFELQPAILKLTINMPAAFTGEVSSVDVAFTNTKFHTKKHVQAAQDVESDDALSMSLSLSSVSLTEGEQLVVYMAMAPLNVLSDVFKLTVTDAQGVQYVSTIEGFAYNFQQAMVCPAVLTVVKQEIPVESITVLALREKAVDLASSSKMAVENVVIRAVVTHVDYNKVYFADQSAAILWYKPFGGHDTYTVGDVYELTPTELTNYKGQLEITGGTSEKVDNPSMSLQTIIADVAIAEIKADADRYRRMHVRLTGVSADNTSWSSNPTLSKDGESMATNSNDSGLTALNTTACTFDVTGMVMYPQSVLQVLTVTNLVESDYINDLAADKATGLAADGSENPVITVGANVSWTPAITGDGASITSYDATTINVNLPENTTDQSVTYTVTVTSEDGTIVKSIELVQLGVGAVAAEWRNLVTSSFDEIEVSVGGYQQNGTVTLGDVKYPSRRTGSKKSSGYVIFTVSDNATKIRFYALPWTSTKSPFNGYAVSAKVNGVTQPISMDYHPVKVSSATFTIPQEDVDGCQYYEFDITGVDDDTNTAGRQVKVETVKTGRGVMIWFGLQEL